MGDQDQLFRKSVFTKRYSALNLMSVVGKFGFEVSVSEEIDKKSSMKVGEIMHELLDVAEVAKRLKCNRNTVYDLIKSGRLVGLKLGRMKVSTMELDDFMRRNAGHDLTDPHNVKQLEVIQ